MPSKIIPTLNHVVRAEGTAAEAGAGILPVAGVTVKVEPESVLVVYGIISEFFFNAPADANVANAFTVLGIENASIPQVVNIITPFQLDESKIIYEINEHPPTASARFADFFAIPQVYTFPGTYAFLAGFSLVTVTANFQMFMTVFGEIKSKNDPFPWRYR